MAGEPIQIAVKLTADDYMALMRFCDRATPGGRARMRRLYLMGVACYLIVVGLAFNHPGHGVANPQQYAVYAASTAVFIGALYYAFLSWLRPTMIRVSLVRGSRRQLLEPTTLTLEEDRLALRNEHGKGGMPWEHLKDMVETDEYLFLVVGSINAIAIPKRCFQSDAHREAALGFLRSHCGAN